MKKAASMCLTMLLAAAVLSGCEQNKPIEFNGGASGSVVVNIEGTVSEVNGNEILLDSGKILVISEDTVFAEDTTGQVSDEFEVGNFVQGYTNDDPISDKVTAAYIYSNVARQTDSG